VDVLAVAGLVAKRLGHEAREQAVTPGDRLDRAFEQQGLIRGQQRILDVEQIELELTLALFSDQRVSGQAECPAGVIDLGERHARRAHEILLDLHGAETEAYLHGLSAAVPAIYVVMRESEGADSDPLDVILVTASPYEAQDYTDSGEEIVEKVPMPAGLVAWVQEFVTAFHEDEVFIKRRRDKTRTDLVQDGIGDPRIQSARDVYASPARQRRRVH